MQIHPKMQVAGNKLRERKNDQTVRWETMVQGCWCLALSFLSFGDHLRAERAAKWIRALMSNRNAWGPVWNIRGQWRVDVNAILGIAPPPGHPVSLAERITKSGKPLITHLQLDHYHRSLHVPDLQHLVLTGPGEYRTCLGILLFLTGKNNALDTLEFRDCRADANDCGPDARLQAKIRVLRLHHCSMARHPWFLHSLHLDMLEEVSIDQGAQFVSPYTIMEDLTQLGAKNLKSIRLATTQRTNVRIPDGPSIFPDSVQFLDISGCKLARAWNIHELGITRLPNLVELRLPNCFAQSPDGDEKKSGEATFDDLTILWVLALGRLSMPALKRVELRTMQLTTWNTLVWKANRDVQKPVCDDVEFIVGPTGKVCHWPRAA